MTHKHLPDIPTANDIQQNRLNMAEINLKLMEKIEELTEQQIELLETIKTQQQTIDQLEEQLTSVSADLLSALED